MLIQTSPIELWVKTAAIDSGLIIRELTGLPKPAVGIAIEPTPIQKRIEINRATTELNAVLLQTPLQLQILLLSRRHEAKAGGPRYRRSAMVASTSLMDFRRTLGELQSGAKHYRECDSPVGAKNGKAQLALGGR
jgi:hypothetical protein